jgi:restriction endonuclease S subunit
MKLSHLATLASGINQKRHPQGNVYYLQARDFIENDLLDSNLKPSIVGYPKLESHYLQKGDVLILSKGHHGFNAFVYNEHKAPAVASSIFLVLKKINPKIIPEFLVWYVNLESTQQQLIGSSRGSALPSINKKILSELVIPVPELQMQKDIIALSKLKQEESKLIEQIDILKSKALEINLKERIQ